MSLFAQASKAIAIARTEQSIVKVFTAAEEAQAIAAGLTANNQIIVQDINTPLVMRDVVVNAVETKVVANGYVNHALIGRDIKTNQTLRTWMVAKADAPAPKVGDLATFPAVFVPFGSFAMTGTEDKTKATTPTQKDGCYVDAGRKNAEIWNAERMAGYAAAVTAVTRKAAVVEP